MTDYKYSVMKRFEAKFKAFNRRMASKLKRRQEILNKMKVEEALIRIWNI